MNIKKISGLFYRAIVIVILLIIVLQPDINNSFISFIYANTIWLIMLLTGAGLMFLFFKNTSFVYFNMICAAMLTLYVKDISNSSLFYNAQENPYRVFSIRQYNCNSLNDNSEELILTIKQNGADVISFMDVCSSKSEFFHSELSEKYPVIAELVDENDRGKLVFSKFEIIGIDTLDLAGSPQFNIEYSVYGTPVNIIFSSIVPEEQMPEKQKNGNQIKLLAGKLNELRYKPLLVIGDFSQVYWSRDMRDFIYITKLNNARRFVNAISNRNPHCHLFYSNHVNCLSFGDIYDSSSRVIGIRGQFEILRQDLAYYTLSAQAFEKTK